MPRKAPIKRTRYTANVSIEILDRFKALSNSSGIRASKLMDEALLDLLGKYAEKGGIMSMDDTKEERNLEHVMFITNHKGGTGKTTAVLNLAYLFSKKGGKRVLLIDTDDQQNLSLLAQAPRKKGVNIVNALKSCMDDEHDIPIDLFIQPTQYKGIDIIVGSRYITDEDFTNSMIKSISEYGLHPWKELISRIEKLHLYDLIIVDGRPSVNREFKLPIQACTDVLMPIEANDMSTQGFIQVYKEILKIRKHGNPKLRFLGCFFNKVRPGTKRIHQYLPSVREAVPAAIRQLNDGKDDGVFFKSTVRLSEDVEQANIDHQAVVERFSNKKAAKDFENVYNELVEVMG